MALLPILEFPDPRLRTQGALVDPAEVTTPAFQTLLDDMFETMYDAPGIGLAAAQVDVHKRFMVIDLTEDRSNPLVFINPKIVDKQGGQVYQEGCLSVPGIFADVTRADSITVQYLDRAGQRGKGDFLHVVSSSSGSRSFERAARRRSGFGVSSRNARSSKST